MIQLALPGLEVGQQCPICGREAAIMGQFSPLWNLWICRECAIQNPVPDGLWLDAEETAQIRRVSKTALRDGVLINPDPALSAAKEWRVLAEGQLKDATRGCKLSRGVGWLQDSPRCWYGEYVPGCKLCERRRRAGSRATQYMRMRGGGGLETWLNQGRFPVCDRCGRVHDRTDSEGRPYWLCQRCEDETTLETLWRMRKIYEGDDPENILDRLYKAFPGLFERGLLPDGWFRLMHGEAR